MEMSETDRLRAWVRSWMVLGPELARLRHEKIRSASTPESIKQFNLAFKAALRNTPPRTTSGLIELQRLLRKLPRK
jgi:hypothetical protein